MKKILALVLATVMLVCCFASCSKSNDDFVATDATDLLQEDFGIAVKKGNTALLNEINAAILALMEDGTIDAIIEKYIPAK